MIRAVELDLCFERQIGFIGLEAMYGSHGGASWPRLGVERRWDMAKLTAAVRGAPAV